MKLLVRNLPRTTTAAELREMFEKYGQLQSCSVVMDVKTGKSKGFGFVEMPKVGDAKAAIQRLNGHMLKGNAIRVKKAEDRAAAPQADVAEEVKTETVVEPVAEPAEKPFKW